MIRHPKALPGIDLHEPGEAIHLQDFIFTSETGQWYPGTYYADGGYAMEAIKFLLRVDLALHLYIYYTVPTDESEGPVMKNVVTRLESGKYGIKKGDVMG